MLRNAKENIKAFFITIGILVVATAALFIIPIVIAVGSFLLTGYIVFVVVKVLLADSPED